MRDVRNSRVMAMEERRTMMWSGRRDMFGRDMYGRVMYDDMYGRDMYGRDMYGGPGFGGGLGGGFGRRGRGLEKTGMGVLIGALMDRGFRSQSSQLPQQPLPPKPHQSYNPDENRYPQDEMKYIQQQEQPGMMSSEMVSLERGGMMAPQQREGLCGPGYGRGKA